MVVRGASGAKSSRTLQACANHCEQKKKDASLYAKVRNIVHGVAETVGKIGGADYQRQFHDLSLVVKLSQLLKCAGTNSRSAPGDAFCKENCGLVLLVE